MFTDNLEITTAHIKTLMLDVYRRYRTGSISPSQAKEESNLLSNLLKSIQEHEQSQRLEDIKNILGN
jgi:hypothetical protein